MVRRTRGGQATMTITWKEPEDDFGMKNRALGSLVCLAALATGAVDCKKTDGSTAPTPSTGSSPVATSATAPASASAAAAASSAGWSPAEQQRYDAVYDKCKANDIVACEALCDEFDPKGCSTAASLMLLKTVPDDPAKRAKLNEKGCAKGALKSCNQLATAYKKGDGVPVDAKKAVELYAKACDGGEGGGCSHLADAYGYGDLVPQDIVKAKAMSAKACQLGYKDCAPPIGDGAEASWPVDAKLEDVIVEPKKWDGHLVQLRGVAAYRGSPTSGYIFAPGGNPLSDGVPTMMDENASPDVKRDWLKMPSSRDGIPAKKVTVRIEATMVPGRVRFFIVDGLQFYGNASE
jgi:TPR repeat protein